MHSGQGGKRELIYGRASLPTSFPLLLHQRLLQREHIGRQPGGRA